LCRGRSSTQEARSYRVSASSSTTLSHRLMLRWTWSAIPAVASVGIIRHCPVHSFLSSTALHSGALVGPPKSRSAAVSCAELLVAAAICAGTNYRQENAARSPQGGSSPLAQAAACRAHRQHFVTGRHITRAFGTATPRAAKLQWRRSPKAGGGNDLTDVRFCSDARPKPAILPRDLWPWGKP
jgi:hypothetical protein